MMRGEGMEGGVTAGTWTHSDEGHFGLVTETFVRLLQFFCLVKYRLKEVHNLRRLES